jgi:protein TonB
MNFADPPNSKHKLRREHPGSTDPVTLVLYFHAGISKNVWRSQLSNAQASNLYPYRAMANEKIGMAVVHCRAKADGALEACALTCEGPAGWGFGRAALKMAPHYKLKPMLADGRSVEGGTLTLPIYFFPSFLPRPARCDQASK